MGPAAESKAISLQVEQPAYISPSIQPAWHLTPLQVSVSSHGSAYELRVVPVGLEVPMSLEFFNQLGLRFDRVRAHLRYRANRYDMLEVRRIHGNNLTLIVRPLAPGRTILRVWVEAAPNLVAHVVIYAHSVIYLGRAAAHSDAARLGVPAHAMEAAGALSSCLGFGLWIRSIARSWAGLSTRVLSRLDRTLIAASANIRGAAYDSVAGGSPSAMFLDVNKGISYLSQAGQLSIYHHFTNRLSTFIQVNTILV